LSFRDELRFPKRRGGSAEKTERKGEGEVRRPLVRRRKKKGIRRESSGKGGEKLKGRKGGGRARNGGLHLPFPPGKQKKRNRSPINSDTRGEKHVGRRKKQAVHYLSLCEREWKDSTSLRAEKKGRAGKKKSASPLTLLS